MRAPKTIKPWLPKIQDLTSKISIELFPLETSFWVEHWRFLGWHHTSVTHSMSFVQAAASCRSLWNPPSSVGYDFFSDIDWQELSKVRYLPWIIFSFCKILPYQVSSGRGVGVASYKFCRWHMPKLQVSVIFFCGKIDIKITKESTVPSLIILTYAEILSELDGVCFHAYREVSKVYHKIRAQIWQIKLVLLKLPMQRKIKIIWGMGLGC